MAPPKGKAKGGARSNGSAVFMPPDALGDGNRKQILKAVLSDLQEQRFRLDISLKINDHDDADIVPGTQSEFNPEGKSYRKRYDEIAAAERRLVENYSDLIEDVEEGEGS